MVFELLGGGESSLAAFAPQLYPIGRVGGVSHVGLVMCLHIRASLELSSARLAIERPFAGVVAESAVKLEVIDGHEPDTTLVAGGDILAGFHRLRPSRLHKGWWHLALVSEIKEGFNLMMIKRHLLSLNW